MSDAAKLADKLDMQDVFWRSDVFPDAKSLISRPRKTLENIKGAAFVVLDANVLLQPYEVDSKDLANEIERVYRILAGEERLVVPGQSVREYYANRHTKITAVVQRLEAALKKLNSQILDRIPLLESDDQLNEVRGSLKEVYVAQKKAADEIRKIIDAITNDVDGDRIAKIYESVLSECVVDNKLDAADKRQIIDDLARRRKLALGPGLSDAGKPDSGIGDLIIWREVISQASRRKCDCILVSQEKKPDWWAPNGGQFQLRPELIAEYRQASDGHTVHMIPLSKLLSIFDAGSDTVGEVAGVEDQENVSSIVDNPLTDNLASALLAERNTLFSAHAAANIRAQSAKGYYLSLVEGPKSLHRHGIWQRMSETERLEHDAKNEAEIRQAKEQYHTLLLEAEKIADRLQTVEASIMRMQGMIGSPPRVRTG